MKGRYFSHPSGGPVWSRDRGYHTPSVPPHIWRIITRPKPAPPTDTGDRSDTQETK